MRFLTLARREALAILLFTLIGAVLAYVDHVLHWQTLLPETVHALVVTTIFIFCLVCQVRYPEVRQFGWNYIVLGVAFLMVGSWVDLLDDPPTLKLLTIGHEAFGRSWEQLFLKKILGYSVGIGLMALGFFRWIPWMIETRLRVEQLNQKLSRTNQQTARILISLDDHVASERLHISRELHDDIAQQLTQVNFQLQLCQKALSNQPNTIETRLEAIRNDISETLKRIRQISQGLRPEPLYALGFIPALSQFLDKMRSQHPDKNITLSLSNREEEFNLLESVLDDRQILHLFRIVQEGLHNTLKHSHANHITIEVAQSDKHFMVRIIDNGVGLPWQTLPNDDTLISEGHLGIVGMKERIQELGATFQLESTPQHGTQLQIKLPLEAVVL